MPKDITKLLENKREPFLKKVRCSMRYYVIMCTPPFLLGGEGGGLNLLADFQKEGSLTGPKFLEGVAGKEGVTFFRGEGAIF